MTTYPATTTSSSLRFVILFFFNDTATTEIYTLSLHDALPISTRPWSFRKAAPSLKVKAAWKCGQDRKSTRLNSSHDQISYAVFFLEKNIMCSCGDTEYEKLVDAVSINIQA